MTDHELTPPPAAGHEIKVTRSVGGSYGWSIAVANEGATADEIRASVEAIRAIDTEMRLGMSETNS